MTKEYVPRSVKPKKEVSIEDDPEAYVDYDAKPTKAEKIAKMKLLRERKKAKSKQQKLMSAGQRHGFLVLIQKVRSKEATSPAIKKRWRCRCEGPILQGDGTSTVCGKIVVIPEMYMRRPENPKLDCGCQGGSLRSRHNNEYRIWLMIRERTRNPEHIANPHYVKRGIDMVDEWYDLTTGFELFLAHVGVRPSKEHSVDRIDNTLGYMPTNMRWASSSQQRMNQGDMVAGYLEPVIVAAGYTREEFRILISNGADEHELIKQGKQE